MLSGKTGILDRAADKPSEKAGPSAALGMTILALGKISANGCRAIFAKRTCTRTRIEEHRTFPMTAV
jgi:hypothetical protein